MRRAARLGLALDFFDIDGIVDGIFLMPLIVVLRRAIHLLVVMIIAIVAESSSSSSAPEAGSSPSPACTEYRPASN